MGKLLGDALHSGCKGLPNVVGIRSLGLAGAVELSSVSGAAGKRAYDIFMDCYHHGVLVRPAGENIVICPPYIIEKEHIARIVDVVGDSIRKNA
jgi:beta-alanine--pyruvate transaminase